MTQLHVGDKFCARCDILSCSQYLLKLDSTLAQWWSQEKHQDNNNSGFHLTSLLLGSIGRELL